MRKLIPMAVFSLLLAGAFAFPSEPIGTGALVRVSDRQVVTAAGEGLSRVFVADKVADMVAARTNGATVVEQREVFADVLAIPLHDAAVKTIFPWNVDTDLLRAARDLGVKYIRTDRPEEAIRQLEMLRQAEEQPVCTGEFRIRDPFILADPISRRYYLYETTAPYFGPAYARGVCVRSSKNLMTWSPLKSVMKVPVEHRARTVWAPEVQRYRGRYWMFATVTQYSRADVHFEMMTDDPHYVMPEMHRPGRRGVWVYVSDSPEGPFEPVVDRSVTPPDWLCLDGTLVVDEGRPYMVFSHEWLQTKVGRVDFAPLSDDLSQLTERPKILFDASAAPGSNCVTDGPFCHRSVSGRLFMIWSKFVTGRGYSVILAESETGRVAGPWRNHHVIYGKNGGHAMVLRTFEGPLKLILHGPERRGWERLRILDLEDTGDDLVVSETCDAK